MEESISSHTGFPAFCEELSTWQSCFSRAVQSWSYSLGQHLVLIYKSCKHDTPARRGSLYWSDNKQKYLQPVLLTLAQLSQNLRLQHCSAINGGEVYGAPTQGWPCTTWRFLSADLGLPWETSHNNNLEIDNRQRTYHMGNVSSHEVIYFHDFIVLKGLFTQEIDG